MAPRIDVACEQRGNACDKRMTTSEKDIQRLYDTKASGSFLKWSLGIFFTLLLFSYGYTTTVSMKLNTHIEQTVTKDDIKELKDTLLEEIKKIKQ